MLQYVPVLGAVINGMGGAAYIRDTLAGRTKPNRVTFLMWGIAASITTAAAFSDGVTWAVLPILVSGVVPLLIVLVSFFNRQASWQLRWSDYLCGLFSVLALALWSVTDTPVVAIAFAIASDAFAAFPTIRKSWTHPETETLSSYVLALIAATTSFFAVSDWKLTAYAWPVYTVMLMAFISLIIFYRRRTMSRVPQPL